MPVAASIAPKSLLRQNDHADISFHRVAAELQQRQRAQVLYLSKASAFHNFSSENLTLTASRVWKYNNNLYHTRHRVRVGG
jgi:hypothetical protein